MDFISPDWSDHHKELNSVIRKTEDTSKINGMILDLHNGLHTSKVSKSKDKNAIDALFDDLRHNEHAIMPTSKDETIAWAVWHIARIEDLTMNILVNNDAQVYDESWQNRMRISVSDTGNAMIDNEIIKKLKPDDMKRKISPDGTSKILQEGGVTEQADSRWLLDFWGKKDVAGIILMPLTRHQTLHLNDCCKWKKSIRRRQEFFAV